MDSYSSSPPPPMGASASPEALMEQIQAELATAYAKEFIETLREKCFDKCITKPGSSLSSGESSCISRCVDRYMEATGIISRSLFSQQRWPLQYTILLSLVGFILSRLLSLRKIIIRPVLEECYYITTRVLLLFVWWHTLPERGIKYVFILETFSLISFIFPWGVF